MIYEVSLTLSYRALSDSGEVEIKYACADQLWMVTRNLKSFEAFNGLPKWRWFPSPTGDGRQSRELGRVPPP
jgi:hypothetical protein